MSHRLSFLLFLASIWMLGGCAKQTTPSGATEAGNTEEKNNSAYLVPIEEEVMPNAQERAEAPIWVVEPGQYNPEQERQFDLLHTRLELTPDWKTQHIRGKATLTLKPWFYERDRVELDAKGFEIKSVKLLGAESPQTLKYTYDQRKISIELPRTFTREEEFQLQIDYLAKPLELMHQDMPFFLEEHGMYFVNPQGKTPNKPQQIWTQGETQNNSCWFPTFDQPNAKTTQEVLITVAKKYKTLSNGKLIASTENPDGTRTDHWKQSKPHAPYLFMLAVGEFAVVEDTPWRGKPVLYYVEPQYAEHAKAIFGRTPEMLDFFSEKFGYEYPWEKYAQVTVRDYISGAMENTSATVHMNEVQRTTQELNDYDWDDLIAHELAHHWFGNLVTCESWANLPLNEAFATYSEFLWMEHKKGVPHAQYWWLNELDDYLYEAQLKREPLIRYRYNDREEMFDSHSYAKGALILHLLRQQVGDAAFFESLKRYLNRYAFGKAEIHDLRLIFEEVTGKDWNWFFEQYFFAAGHPEVSIYQVYQDGQLEVTASQVQPEDYSPIYRLPLSIRIWKNGQAQTHRVVMTKREHTFTFPMSEKPDAVVFDADHEVIGNISHEQDQNALLHILKHAKDYRTRAQAIEQLSAQLSDTTAVSKLFYQLMEDDFWAIRASAARAFTNYSDTLPGYADVKARLQQLAQNDPDPKVRMNAVDALASFTDIPNTFFEKKIEDTSFFVKRSALFALAIRMGRSAKPYFEAQEASQNSEIVMLLADYYSIFGTPGKLDWFLEKMSTRSGTNLSYLMNYFAAYLPSLSAQDKRRAADYLVRQARDNSYFQTRKEAFQHLLLLEDVEGVKAELDSLRRSEKDRRVADFQKAIGG